MAFEFGYAKNAWPSGELSWPDSPSATSASLSMQFGVRVDWSRKINTQWQTVDFKRLFTQVMTTPYEYTGFFAQIFFSITDFSFTFGNYCKMAWPSYAWPYQDVYGKNFRSQTTVSPTGVNSFGTQFSLNLNVESKNKSQIVFDLSDDYSLKTSVYIPCVLNVYTGAPQTKTQFLVQSSSRMKHQVRWRPF